MNSYHLAVLTGNGMTTAFNEKLRLGSLTEKAFEQMPNSETAEILKTILQDSKPGADSDDFEELLGALESMGRSVRLVGRLVESVEENDESLQGSLTKAFEHIARMHRYGKSHVLETIFKLTTEDFQGRQHLIEAIAEIVGSTSGSITFGNLNYDTTILSALLSECHDDMCDMGDGRKAARQKVGSTEFDVQPLRSTDDLPDKKICLLHLHGSVTYWHRRNKTDTGIKLRNSQIGQSEIFDEYRENTIDWRPSVVLTTQNRKSRRIENNPFKYAYSKFSVSLIGAPKWLIIGYSFKDSSVNAMLRECIKESDSQPDILVVGYNDDPTRAAVIDALGWNEDLAYEGDGVLNVISDGAQSFVKGIAWRRFSRKTE